MRIVTLNIGTAPAEEACAQTGVTANWIYLQQLECEVYRGALIATYGAPPPGVTMPVRTNAHDFGSYIELELHFDADDEIATAYAEKVEAGLSTWLDANMSPPVTYDDRGRERPGSRRLAADCITGAIVTNQRLVDGGYATDRERRIVDNLKTAFPACATSAEALLASLTAASAAG